MSNKENKFSIISVLYLLLGATAAIQLVSAVGSSCVALDSNWWKIPSFSIVGDYSLLYQACYVITWFVAILLFVLIWAFKTKKEWFYKTAVITSIAGIISGFIPVALLFIGGMRFTPSWFRVIMNLLVLVLLLIPKYSRSIQGYIQEGITATGGGLVDQVASMAFLFFGFGLIMLIQPFIMPATHMINGVNIGYEFEDLQFYGGLLAILIGVLIELTSKLYYRISPLKAPIKV